MVRSGPRSPTGRLAAKRLPYPPGGLVAVSWGGPSPPILNCASEQRLLLFSELRLIEVKGIGASDGTVVLTPHEHEVAEDRRDCYWLYVVTNCNASPTLTMTRDPAAQPWQPVKKVRIRRSIRPTCQGRPHKESRTMASPKTKKNKLLSAKAVLPTDIKRLSVMVAEGEGPSLEFKRSTGELKEAADPLCLPQRCRRHGALRRPTQWHRRRTASFGPDASRHRPSWSAVRAARRPHAPASPRAPSSEVLALTVKTRPDTGPFVYDGRPYERVASTTRRMAQTKYDKRLLSCARHVAVGRRARRGLTLKDLDRKEILRTRELAIQHNRISWTPVATSARSSTASGSGCGGV